MNLFIQIPAISRTLTRAWMMGVLVSAAVLATEVIAEPSSTELQMEIVRHHVVPEALCAAGVTETQVAGMLNEVFDAIDEHWDALASSQSTLELLKQESGQLQRLIASGRADETEITRFGELGELIETANVLYQAVYDTVDQSLLESMSLGQQQTFLAIRANAHRGVPMEYRVLSLDEDEWIELRDAIAANRTFDYEVNDEEPTAAQQLMNQYDGNYEVNLARANLQTRLDAVSQKFMAAINPAD